MGTEVMIFRLVLAGLLGGLIGVERERHGRPAWEGSGLEI